MTGRQFEDMCVDELKNAGYWVHRIHPDESGQQPFDIIAIRDNKVCVYDAKVISNGHRFPLSRIEDNQWYAFNKIKKRTSATHIGLLIYAEGKIYYMGFGAISAAFKYGWKSIDTNNLPEWRPL